MRESTIEWCDGTVNPTSGCDGCELWIAGKGGTCYAGNYHEGRMANALPQLYAKNFDEVRLIPGRMKKAAGWSDLTSTDRPDKPWLNGMPRVIFIGDMGDTLSKSVPFEYLETEIINNVTSAKGSRHIWMWLTKQTKRLVEFSDWLRAKGCKWPVNLWPGTSITRRATLSRAVELMHVGDQDNTTRFLSVEPLLEEVDVSFVTMGADDGSGWTYRHWNPLDGANWCDCQDFIHPCGTGKISLVIIGGESGPGARPTNVDAVRSIMQQCKEAEPVEAAIFVKQLGSHVHDQNTTPAGNFPNEMCWPDGTKTDYHRVLLKDSKGGAMEEWPPDLRIRQLPAPAGSAVGR